MVGGGYRAAPRPSGGARSLQAARDHERAEGRARRARHYRRDPGCEPRPHSRAARRRRRSDRRLDAKTPIVEIAEARKTCHRPFCLPRGWEFPSGGIEMTPRHSLAWLSDRPGWRRRSPLPPRTSEDRIDVGRNEKNQRGQRERRRAPKAVDGMLADDGPAAEALGRSARLQRL